MRNKERKKAYGEVFTPPALVNEMLDKIPIENYRQVEKTFLDNSCGNGNFLVEVLRRKLLHNPNKPLKCLASIYGVDLLADNVAECKARLKKIVLEHRPDLNESLVDARLHYNIVCADALKYHYNFDGS